MKKQILTDKKEEYLRNNLFVMLQSKELNLNLNEIGDLTDDITELVRQVLNES